MHLKVELVAYFINQKQSTIKSKIAKFIFGFHNWTLIGKPIPKEVMRCVFVFAPHTSNWDFYYGVMCMIGWGIPIKVAIKKEWMRFPVGWFIKAFGGVGIDRTKKLNKTEQIESLAKVFDQYDEIAFIITPEGSRSLREEWKLGFYYIAKQANVPIVTLTGNYSSKTIEYGPVLDASKPLEEVMKTMMDFYKTGEAKFPENFSVDKRF